MSERLAVTEPGGLFEFLAGQLKDWNRNTLRQRLRAGCVKVNGEVVVKSTHPVAAGDQLEVVALDEGRRPSARKTKGGGPPRLFEDEHLIAIDKPSGLLSVPTDRVGASEERTALSLVRDALSRPGRPVKLWPVHRIDRGTSGVLLLARSREACEEVRADWADAKKTYLAIVEGRPNPAEGTIDQPLFEDRALNVHVGKKPGSKHAVTHYKTLSTHNDRSLLEIQLETGRRHQIRVHLAWLGHPLLGDERYGQTAGRLALHATRLQLEHPFNGPYLDLVAPPPPAFTRMHPGS